MKSLVFGVLAITEPVIQLSCQSLDFVSVPSHPGATVPVAGGRRKNDGNYSWFMLTLAPKVLSNFHREHEIHILSQDLSPEMSH